jgi:hypothetical protein
MVVEAGATASELELVEFGGSVLVIVVTPIGVT